MSAFSPTKSVDSCSARGPISGIRQWFSRCFVCLTQNQILYFESSLDGISSGREGDASPTAATPSWFCADLSFGAFSVSEMYSHTCTA